MQQGNVTRKIISSSFTKIDACTETESYHKGLWIIVERCGEHCKMLRSHHGYNKCFAKFFQAKFFQAKFFQAKFFQAKFFQAKLLFVAGLFEIVMLEVWFELLQKEIQCSSVLYLFFFCLPIDQHLLINLFLLASFMLAPLL